MSFCLGLGLAVFTGMSKSNFNFVKSNSEREFLHTGHNNQTVKVFFLVCETIKVLVIIL